MVDALLSVFFLGLVPVLGVHGDGSSASLGADLLSVSPPTAFDAPSLSELAHVSNGLSASGILILDLDSGQPIYERDADVPRPMASLTKLMTALIIVENHDMGEWVTISEAGVVRPGESSAQLREGDQYTVGDLLSALLILSANDAAVALAQHHSGSTAAFVEEMNERAKELGMKSTSYSNPTGLDASLQKASPQDLAWLTMFAYRYPDIRVRMGTPEATIQSRGGHVISLSHTHQLLHEQSPVVAGKTGTTDGAGQCLLSVVQENGRRYLVILLHSVDRYRDMRAVLRVLHA